MLCGTDYISGWGKEKQAIYSNSRVSAPDLLLPNPAYMLVITGPARWDPKRWDLYENEMLNRFNMELAVALLESVFLPEG